MKYRKIFFPVILIVVLVLSACSNDPITNNTFSVSITVEDDEGYCRADSIILTKDNEIINYIENSSAAEFTELKRGKYNLIIGKEGYQAHIQEYHLDSSQNINVQLDAGNDYTDVNIFVKDAQEDIFLDDVKVTVYKDNTWISEEETIDGKVSFDNITRGVIYTYIFEKNGYENTSLRLYNTRYTGNHGPVYMSRLSQGEKNFEKYIFRAEERKKVSLGTVSPDEEIVVGIVPLLFDPANNNNYRGKISVDFTRQNIESNMTVVEGNEIKNKLEKIFFEKNNNEINTADKTLNKKQIEADRYMREKEQELSSELDFNQLKKDISIRQQSIIEQQRSLEIGDKREFNVLFWGGFTPANKKVMSTLRAVSENGLFYVEDGVRISSARMVEMAEEFEDIFHTNMKVFSSRSSYQGNYYDYDGNQKVIILLSEFDSGSSGGIVAGYFNSADFFSNNKADMIYINSLPLTSSSWSDKVAYQTLAHEFQHLLFFVEKSIYAGRRAEDIWINEGFSSLAEQLTGYYTAYDFKNDSRIASYFNDPNYESLVHWSQEYKDYGSVRLFTLYLYNKYGDDIIKEINRSASDPVDVISKYESTHFEGFSDLMQDWVLSNYANDYQVNDYYRYRDINGRYFNIGLRPRVEKLKQGVDSFEIKPTAVKYYLISPESSIHVDLSVELGLDTGIVIFRR